jgi:tetratricopeptide (TPR) repeat protein
MTKQMTFIGRQQELAQIDNLINEWDSRRVAFINGGGGIGKTRLLQEIYARYRINSKLCVAEIIDLDDPNLHTSESVGQKIADLVGLRHFAPYQELLRDWHKMERAGVSLAGLDFQSKKVRQAFIDNFNQATAGQRVVLFLDTTDRFGNTELWDYLSHLIGAARNVVFLIAGRNAAELGIQQANDLGEDVFIIDLRPLVAEDSEKYLRQKLAILRIPLAPELAKKLLILAEGRPILIDLATEWIARNIPLDWTLKGDAEALEKLSPEGLQRQRKHFEAHLVLHIADVRNAIDRLTLLMSRVYPLKPEMVAWFLDIPVDEAKTLVQEAKTYVFVKQLPDGRISLHDEMRRMVIDHVWPELDPDGDRQRGDSRAAIAYIEKEIESLKKHIATLASVEDFRAMTLRDTLEGELWVQEEQRLHHTLYVDLDEGFKTFIAIFDEADKAYHPHIRGLLLETIQPFCGSLSPEQRYQVSRRKAQYLFDITRYTDAKEVLIDLLEKNDLRTLERIDLPILLANTEIRLGNVRVGVSEFEKAHTLAQAIDDVAVRARVKNMLGWGYRRLGQFEKAVDYYSEALNLIGLGDKTPENQTLEGEILNNMAYAYSRLDELGLAEAAVDIVARAEKLWQTLNNRRGLGGLYIVCMTIYKRRREFEKILKYGNLAEAIFGPQNDIASLCSISYERGVAYWNLGQLQYEEQDSAEAEVLFRQAEKWFKKALNYQIKLYIPDHLYWLAETYISTGQLDLALQHCEEGYRLAQDPRDSRFHLFLLAQRAHIAGLMDQFDILDELREKYKVYEAYQKETGFEEPGAEGLYAYFFANLALERYFRDRNMIDMAAQAIASYQAAFPKIAKRIVYGKYPLPKLLVKLEEKLNAVSDPEWIEFKKKLGHALRQTWDTTYVELTGLTKKYPYAISYFDAWRRS